MSAAVAVVVYALLWIGFALQWNWLAELDSSSLDALYRYGVARPGWVMAWDVFCTLFGPTAFRLVALVVIVVALYRRKLHAALFLVITVELSGLITEIAKQAADRPRPSTAFVYAQSTSFPSGHAVGVMIGVLALLTVAWPTVRRPLRPTLVALGVVLVVAIGAGRVVLNVHYASDVLAGWALGYAYFVACLLMVPPRLALTEADEIPVEPGSAR